MNIAPDTTKSRILIFYDEGVGPNSFVDIFYALTIAVDAGHCQIHVVDGAYLSAMPDWEHQTCLLVIPGGRSLPYYTALGEQGNQRIRSYVCEGGNYLGICAGAYYGAAHTRFAAGMLNEVDIKGPLNFYPGTAQGPAYPLPFDYCSDIGVCVAKITTDLFEKNTHHQLNVYFNGGCYFSAQQQSDNVTVLARYADIAGQPPAIVECRIGQGKAILTGVHIEVSSQSRLLNNLEQKLCDKIYLGNKQRQQLLNKLLQHCSIELK